MYRHYATSVSEWIANFLESLATQPVQLVPPGAVRNAVPADPPAAGESLETILADFERIVAPAVSFSNHPGFLGYFASSGSVPGILGENLIAAIDGNAMVWRACPAAVELEEVMVDWVRRLIGLPGGFRGLITDGGSTSTLHALAAAREIAYPEARARGLSGLRLSPSTAARKLIRALTRRSSRSAWVSIRCGTSPRSMT